MTLEGALSAIFKADKAANLQRVTVNEQQAEESKSQNNE